MFYAQLKLVVRENGRFLRYENLASSSLEDLNKDVDVRMRDLRPLLMSLRSVIGRPISNGLSLA